MKNIDRRYDAILLLGLTLGENDQPEEELCIRVHAAAKATEAVGKIKTMVKTCQNTMKNKDMF